MIKRKLCIIAALFCLYAVQTMNAVQNPNAVQTLNDVWNLNAVQNLNAVADFDVRDGQNKPVSSLSAHTQLITLFQENLYRLRVLDPSHSIRQSMDGLNLYLSLFLSVFFNSSSRILSLIEQAIAPSKRRFVHNVDKLWITFIVGLFACFLQICRTHLTNGPLRLNLRC